MSVRISGTSRSVAGSIRRPAGRVMRARLSCAAREIALPGTCLHPLAAYLHLERVHLAVERGRREAERVLVMQLVRHARKGGGEIVGRRELEISAAGGGGNLRESLIRLI